MISISEVIREIVYNDPVIKEAFSKGIVNNSQLARVIHNSIESKAKKPVTLSSIIIALNRLEKSEKQQPKFNFKKLVRIPNIIVRSNLFEYTLQNSPTLSRKHQTLLTETEKDKHLFATITTGVFETTIVASEELSTKIQAIYNDENKIGELHELASITLSLTKEILETPGTYAYVLNALAIKDINIIEFVSTYLELTIIVKNDDVDAAFTTLKKAITN